jgi:hypothetical protein
MPVARLYVRAMGTQASGWDNEGSAPFSQYVDDKPDHDGAATALYSPTNNDRMSFFMDTLSLPSGYAIQSVVAHAVAAKPDPVDALMALFLKIAGTNRNGSDKTPTAVNTWQDLSQTWTGNPGLSNAAWTVEAINALEVGIRKTNAVGLRVTQVYLDVNYTAPVASAASGKIKAQTATGMLEKPVKVWMGTAYVQKPVKFWSGTTWTLADA